MKATLVFLDSAVSDYRHRSAITVDANYRELLIHSQKERAMSATLRSTAPRQQVSAARERYLTHTNHLMMTVLDFSDGPAEQPDPPHSHPHEQITYVAEGRVRFFLDGQPYDLSAGDMIAVEADIPHSIQLLTPSARLVDTFTPIREDFLKKNTEDHS